MSAALEEALRNPETVRAILSTPYRTDNGVWRAMLDPEPWPHMVHYQKHRAIYVRPDEYLWWKPEGPSDCTWIIPGTLERWL